MLKPRYSLIRNKTKKVSKAQRPSVINCALLMTSYQITHHINVEELNREIYRNFSFRYIRYNTRSIVTYTQITLDLASQQAARQILCRPTQQ